MDLIKESKQDTPLAQWSPLGTRETAPTGGIEFPSHPSESYLK